MTASSTGTGDGLLRWLVGGLVVGGIVLGLLVGAYEIGYHRGHAHRSAASGPTRPAATTATTATTAPTTPTTTPATTPAAGAAAARGAKLFAADGCASCHSLDGSPGVGPTLAGLAGSSVKLTDGTTVTADRAYLTRSITDPDGQIVAGYQKGVMPGAIASFGLTGKPADVAALVAFLEQPRKP